MRLRACARRGEVVYRFCFCVSACVWSTIMYRTVTICVRSLAGCIGNELFCRHTVHREGRRMVWVWDVGCGDIRGVMRFFIDRILHVLGRGPTRFFSKKINFGLSWWLVTVYGSPQWHPLVACCPVFFFLSKPRVTGKEFPERKDKITVTCLQPIYKSGFPKRSSPHQSHQNPYVFIGQRPLTGGAF